MSYPIKGISLPVLGSLVWDTREEQVLILREDPRTFAARMKPTQECNVIIAIFI